MGPCSQNVKVMTEETPKKKPRRKRRTKAQIEADKAAKEAKVIEESVAVESPIVNPEPVPAEPDPEDEERYIPREESAAAALEAAEAELEKEVEPEPEPEPAIEEPSVVNEEPVASVESTATDDDPIVDHSGRHLSEISNRLKARRARRRLGL